MVKIKDIHFCVKNLKMKRKKGKKILTFRSRDLNPRFSVIFPTMIWIFMESKEPEIKSKQASKRDMTLLISFFFTFTALQWVLWPRNLTIVLFVINNMLPMPNYYNTNVKNIKETIIITKKEAKWVQWGLQPPRVHLGILLILRLGKSQDV